MGHNNKNRDVSLPLSNYPLPPGIYSRLGLGTDPLNIYVTYMSVAPCSEMSSEQPADPVTN